MTDSAEHDGRNDFDFWMGSWKGHNRRLAKRLAASDEWIECDSVSKAWPLLGGLGDCERAET